MQVTIVYELEDIINKYVEKNWGKNCALWNTFNKVFFDTPKFIHIVFY